jgi:hypothetical protein
LAWPQIGHVEGGILVESVNPLEECCFFQTLSCPSMPDRQILACTLSLINGMAGENLIRPVSSIDLLLKRFI